MQSVRRWVITQGIRELLETKQLTHAALEHVIRTAQSNFAASYMIVFKQKQEQVIVSNGNDQTLAKLSLHVPETIWCIQDDYGDHFVGTVLLPNEY